MEPMPDVLRSTPLFAIRAVVLDAETTGLDVRRARLIEIGAVHLDGTFLQQGHAFQSLIACPEPVPASATAIHGIGDADLAGAPAFATLFDALIAFIGGRVVIGHTIGFDLALLKQEAERLGKRFEAPAALDVRLLAQIAEPSLPSYSLEALCAWLGIPLADRHRALGDAVAAGRIMVALAPRLRDRGIRTVGEAIAARRRIADALAGAAPTAWDLAGPVPGGANAIAKLDSYPYRHRLADVMTPDPCFLPADTPLQAALRVMAERKLSSVLVGAADSTPEETGIVTERDVLRHIAAAGAEGLDTPLAQLASRPVIHVPEDAFLYRAIGRLSNRRVRHLAVTDADERIVGMVTTRDLLRLRAESAVALGDDIDRAPTVDALGQAWGKLPAMAAALVAEEVPARTIAAIIAREVGALTRRATALAEAELAASGETPPCLYAVLVLGSAGRGESLLAMDQDNGLVFAEGEPDGANDRYFARLGERMTTILHAVGVPFCKGGVMASRPALRGSLATWQMRIAQWIARSRPEDLLAVDVFFDFRIVCGDRSLATRLWTEAWAAAHGEIAFLKLLAEAAGDGRSGLGFLGRLRTEEDGRIDLKHAGLKGIVTTARLLALRHGIAVHATVDRLKGVAALGVGGADDLAALDEGHAVILDAILRQQLADIAAGRPPDNRVDPAILPKDKAAALKKIIGRLSILDDLRRDQLS